MRKIFRLSMKPHRYIQLFGLYGVLFLIPLMQQQISNYASEEERYKRDQIYYVAERLYYDLKRLTCFQHGQESTTQDCKKGIYQNMNLSLAVDFEKNAAESKSSTLSIYWVVYYLFALMAFIGSYMEYRKEYLNEV